MSYSTTMKRSHRALEKKKTISIAHLVRSDGDRNVRRRFRFHFAHAFRDRHLRRGEGEALVVPGKVVRAVNF